MRSLSFLGRPSPAAAPVSYNDIEEENDADSTITKIDALPAPALKAKRVDYYYNRWSKGWKYRNMKSKIAVEGFPILQGGSSGPWKDCSFVTVRTIPQDENDEPTFKIVIMSEYVLKACKDVIQSWPGLSWNSDPLEIDPEIFLTFYQEFVNYRDALSVKKPKSLLETYTHSSVDLLISSLSTDYRSTLANVSKLTSHGEITFDLLYAILVPRSIIVTTCAVTGLPRLFKLISSTRGYVDSRSAYHLTCESVDLIDGTANHNVRVGRAQSIITIGHFEGTVQITSLDAFPLKYHPEAAKLPETIIRRGRKWVGLIGVHHKQYKGIAASKSDDKVFKHDVDGRIMIDRATFRRQNGAHPLPVPSVVLPPGFAQPNDFPYIPPQSRHGTNLPPMYHPPPSTSSWAQPMPYVGGPHGRTLVQSNSPTVGDGADVELSDDELLLTSTVVYGFSLNDKIWLEFNVEQVQDVEWSSDAFANLVLPSGHKELLQSLVEAHHHDTGFDDFIKGKGHGLVVNLFGPPGVGKTFSAEATSEHVKRPLYVIGGGDLGTHASDLDFHLKQVLDIATAWKALVLIDEADVFLEQRSLHDLERNAMVAVFLRHVEYYRGILFLTTNRVKTFDEAFLSRIHVALHFHELTQESKEQVWAAFIAKAGASGSVTQEQIQDLARRDVNGRQIKNAARTAHSLALGRGEQIAFRHFVETLDAIDDFTKQFKKTQALSAFC